MTFKEFRQDLQERLAQDPDLKTDRSTPAKNYRGLSKSTKEARERHWEKNRENPNNPKAYEPAPGDAKPGDANAKTERSKYTKAFEKKFGKTNEGLDLDSAELVSKLQKKIHDLGEDYTEEDLEKAIAEMEGEISEDVMDLGEDLLDEDSSVDTALKNKAEKTGYSVSHLRAIYNRGLAAWKTSHRVGANQHAWAMARVASVVMGGKARQSDKDIWEKMQASKKKKKKD